MPTKTEIEAYLATYKVQEHIQEAIAAIVNEGMLPPNPLAVIGEKLKAASSAVEDVSDRPTLWQALHAAAGGDAAKVTACLCSYSPPPARLIIRSDADFASLGTTKEAVHAACDPAFWAYGDFEKVHASFSLEESDAERRVMGIEGVGSPEALLVIIEGGAKSLKIGHLSLPMMQGKLANGEWRWIDEARCVMHTATPKPALLRTEVRSRLGVELRVMRHEEFAQGAESVGDLIIFDMDKSDVTKETGNRKVFCQDPANYKIAPYDGLADDMKVAVDRMLASQFVPKP